MTQTPIPNVPTQKYGVIWEIDKGCPFGETEGDTFTPGGQSCLEVNELGIPILGETENTVTNDEGEEEVEVYDDLSYFHTEFQWNSVELKYEALEDGVQPLVGFRVKAKVFGYTEQMTPSGTPSITITLKPYKVRSLTIESEDPNNSGTWVYPDDYDVIEDPNHPKQYGGVILYSDFTTDTLYKADEQVSVGIEDGPSRNGITYWKDTQENTREATSGYTFTEVFDQCDFAYIPRNSISTQESERKIDGNKERFKTTPEYPDLVDPDGKPAPIYPMDSVTRFAPDPRDEVTVKYKIKIECTDDKDIPIVLENPEIEVKQKCTQDTSDYTDQIQYLMSKCNFANPGKHQEFSSNYPYNYPYTLVTGFDGLEPGTEPVTRGDEVDNEPLQKGDIWYDPSTQERKYYSRADIPDTFTVVNPGRNYRNKKKVICVWQPEDYCRDMQDRDMPYGLEVDTETNNGELVGATISEGCNPQAYRDGDIVLVSGGNNQGSLMISIDTEAGWTLQKMEMY